MQADKEPAAAAAAAPAAGKPPSICDRLQRAFHARPAFRPLGRLTVRHQDGGGAAKPDAGAGDGASAAPGPAPKAKHSGPPLPAAPRPLTPPSPAPVGSGAPPATAPQAEQPVPVRLPAVTSKVAAGSGPTGPPVPVPPPDVMAGMATAADAKAGDIGQQTTGKTRVGSRVRKALSSK
ncbi:unnamed protein product [Miscanthus lutarioriparius]|uniref:Uncharacterized protein n=1 Tax=Miscanthus lutarioriparius TaxID=422564 RepID=A0A811MCY5_9POAL|nr:unnamed protein product [Miscanthus lutarioriparius]